MDTEGTEEAVNWSTEAHELAAISPELREQWSMQAELDVRNAGLSRLEAVDVGIGIWNKGLVAGIRWCREQLAALDDTPKACTACGLLWPADSFNGDSLECIECAPIPA